MWFGDLVTTAWWDDIWLNEAFATWMGHRTEAEWFPDGEYSRLTLTGGFDVMKLDSLPSARRIREPIHSVDDIDNAFDDITYSKGAAVLAMFENYVGDAAFRDGVRLHMQRHAYGNATTDEFLHSVADGSQHQEIVAAFHTFTDQPNVPLVTVHANCGAGGNGSVSVAQIDRHAHRRQSCPGAPVADSACACASPAQRRNPARCSPPRRPASPCRLRVPAR